MDARGSLRQVALSQTLNQDWLLYFPSLVPDSKGLPEAEVGEAHPLKGSPSPCKAINPSWP